MNKGDRRLNDRAEVRREQIRREHAEYERNRQREITAGWDATLKRLRKEEDEPGGGVCFGPAAIPRRTFSDAFMADYKKWAEKQKGGSKQ